MALKLSPRSTSNKDATQALASRELLCQGASANPYDALNRTLATSSDWTRTVREAETALERAVEAGNLETVKLIVNESGSAYDLSENNNALLRRAAVAGHQHIVDWFLYSSGQFNKIVMTGGVSDLIPVSMLKLRQFLEKENVPEAAQTAYLQSPGCVEAVSASRVSSLSQLNTFLNQSAVETQLTQSKKSAQF